MTIKLSAQQIRQFMANATNMPGFNIVIQECLPSTNDHLLALLETQTISKTALLVETQTHGKGRQGRSWIFAPGNIFLSVYWPFACKFEDLYGLSLVVGIAVARVLKNIGLLEVRLKWPNDIYWQNRKMGGILIETKQNRSGVIDAVIGLGLNILEVEGSNQSTSVERALGRTLCRNKLVAELLVELDRVLQTFEREGFGAFTAEWQELDAKITSPSAEEMDALAKIIHARNLHDSYTANTL